MSTSLINNLSIEWPPAKNYDIASYPKWTAKGKTPIELHTENLPPTKSQNAKTFLSSIPNYPVSVKLVEQAQTCLLITYF